MTIVFDQSAFVKSLEKYTEEVLEGLKDGLEVAGNIMIQDAVHRDPKPFLDTGFLQGSSFVMVSGRNATMNPIQAVVSGQTAYQKNLPLPKDGLSPYELRVGFLAEYAIFLHDNPDAKPLLDARRGISKKKGGTGTYSIPKKASMEGRGAFWLSKKMEDYTDSVYIPAIQATLNKRLNGKNV